MFSTFKQISYNLNINFNILIATVKIVTIQYSFTYCRKVAFTSFAKQATFSQRAKNVLASQADN